MGGATREQAVSWSTSYTLLAHHSPYIRRRHRAYGLPKVESRLSCDSIPTTKTRQRIHCLLETRTFAPALLIAFARKEKGNRHSRRSFRRRFCSPRVLTSLPSPFARAPYFTTPTSSHRAVIPRLLSFAESNILIIFLHSFLQTPFVRYFPNRRGSNLT